MCSVQLILGYAHALHRAGAPTPRVEALTTDLARGLGVDGQLFGVPTALIASLVIDGEPRTQVIELDGADIDLRALSALEELGRAVAAGEVAIGEAESRLGAIVEAAPRWSATAVVLAFAGLSGAAGIVLGGGVPEALVAALAGLGTGLLAVFGAGRLFELGAALQAAFLASASARAWGAELEPALLGGLIVLVPGFTLWQGMSELSTGHLVSGTTRLARALSVLLLLGVGFALGVRLAEGLVPVLATDPAAGAGFAVPTGVAVLATAPAMLVLFGGLPRELPWIAGSALLAWLGSMAGTAALGPELGTFVAAAGIGLFSRVFVHRTGRSAAVAQVPGIMLLVPGSIGFRAIAALLADDPLTGVEAGFEALVVAVSLVAGGVVAEVGRVPRTRSKPEPTEFQSVVKTVKEM